MATFSQLPGTLDIAFVQGDEVNKIGCDFDVDLTGYSFTAPIYVATVLGTGGGGAGVTTTGATAAAFTVTPVDLAAGKVNLSLTETQTNSLSTAVGYRWYLRWVSGASVTRTVLSGDLNVTAP